MIALNEEIRIEQKKINGTKLPQEHSIAITSPTH
jgi:hypothetical protein